MIDNRIVRVPRAVIDTYWHLPWSAVVAAAEAKTDGLTFAEPSLRRDNWDRDQMVENIKASYAERRAKDVFRSGLEIDEAAELAHIDGSLRDYDANVNLAYLRQGDERSWGPDKTLLLQQNWSQDTPYGD
jgi:hypothetical protein